MCSSDLPKHNPKILIPRHALNKSHLCEPHTSHSNHSSPFILLLPALTFSLLLLQTSTNHSTITLKSFPKSPHRTKSSVYKRSGNLPFFPSPSSLLHHCIHIYIEKPRGHDTPLSHPNVYPKQFTLTSFYLTQAELSTYILLIPSNSLLPKLYILNTCHKVSQLTLSYAFSKSIKPSYTMFFLS